MRKHPLFEDDVVPPEGAAQSAVPAPKPPAKVGDHVAAIQKGVDDQGMVLVGREASGSLFTIKGLAAISAQITRMVDKASAAVGGMTMQEQYDELRDNLTRLLGGKSFKKSILLTGAPRSGKTFGVEEGLAALGKTEGTDYYSIKGSTSDADAYKMILTFYDKLLVFDDCDSIQKTTDGANMLKAALDSKEKRIVSRNTGNMLNVRVLTAHERNDYTAALSKVLRAQQTEDDEIVIETTLHGLGLLPRILKIFKKEMKYEKHDPADGEYVSSLGSRMDVILEYARNHLPNMFEFTGKVIFISNLSQSQWDSAVVERSISQDMNFTSREMLDFISKIAGKMKSELPISDRQEVIDYLGELHDAGSLKRAVNFGVVQEAWDIRMTPNWKKKIARW